MTGVQTCALPILNIVFINDSSSTPSLMDSQMVESAASYIAALSKPGTNFLGNEYVKHKVIEALLPPNIKSDRAISRRLDVNRQLLPKLMEKRRKFNDISSNLSNNRLGMLIQCAEEVMDDSTLAEQEKDFVGNHLAEELGLLHLFSDSGIEPDDDFYYHHDEGAPVEVDDSVQVKKKKDYKHVQRSSEGNSQEEEEGVP